MTESSRIKKSRTKTPKISSPTEIISGVYGIKRKFIASFIIISILLFLSQLYIGYKIEKVLDEVEKKPDVYGFIVPYLQQGISEDFLPVVILNTGDLPLYNVTVGIKSCVMGDDAYPETHTIPILLQQKEYIIPFGDHESIKDFKRVWCTPSSNYPYPSISFNPFGNQSNSTTTTTCGECFYTLWIYSDKINKTIHSSYRSPVDITITVEPK